MTHPDAAPPSALPEIVLLSVAEIGSGALQAHLGELARRLSADAVVHWGALTAPRLLATRRGRADLRAFRGEVEATLSGKLVVLPLGPRYGAVAAASTALGLALRARGVGRAPVLHGRGYLATLAAVHVRRFLPGASILHDVRGDRPSEVRIHGGEYAPERVAALEGAACRAADAHLAVSEPLRELMRARHGVDAWVFQSAADTERFRPDPEGGRRVRERLGVAADAFVLGYVGSAAPWQRPDAVAALFRRLRSLQPASRLLVLSPGHEEWARFLAGHGLPCDVPGAPSAGAPAIVRSVPHADVPAWFSACDATALLRDDDDVNRVASPIKFGESLACGVPVVVTRGVGDASALVRELGVGACLDDALAGAQGDVDRIADLVRRAKDGTAALRESCRRAAEERWSWSSQMPLRREIYSRLAAGAPSRAWGSLRPAAASADAGEREAP